MSSFQTNPRGVGGQHRTSPSRYLLGFQTNPRGVGGTGQLVVGRSRTNGFRPTLVGSEDRQGLSDGYHCLVSDQPSWGRRPEQHRDKVVSHSGFRPTLVGSEATTHQLTNALMVSDQPSWGRRLLMKFGKLKLMAFQTNPRGVGGDHSVLKGHDLNGFQTNPRGVGGTV